MRLPACERSGVLREVDDLGQLALGLRDSGDIVEADAPV